VAWLIPACDMTHLYVWHDSFNSFRLREELYEIFLEFDLNVDYGMYRKRQFARFKALFEYDKVAKKPFKEPTACFFHA